MSAVEVLKKIDAEFPTVKSEEYRYSTVLDALQGLSIKAQSGQSFSLPQKFDFTFFADQKTEGSAKSFEQLHANFQRHQNYFKKINLASNSDFNTIVCDKAEMSLAFAASESSMNQHNVHIHVPANQKSTIHIHFFSQKNSVLMPLIFVEAEKDTHVEIIYTVETAHNHGVILPTFEFIAQDRSHSSLQTFTQGISKQRVAFIGYCAGEKSHIDLRTGFNLKDQESCDLFVRMHHEAPDSTSNQMIKSVADDKSQMNFNGLIFANKQAHNIYAYQMLKGMLLSDDADIYARPQLDIDYYELACSHGVSIGGFDPEELFYLKSRGVQDSDAYALLLYGFFTEPFVEIEHEEYWQEYIKAKLGTAQI